MSTKLHIEQRPPILEWHRKHSTTPAQIYMLELIERSRTKSETRCKHLERTWYSAKVITHLQTPWELLQIADLRRSKVNPSAAVFKSTIMVRTIHLGNEKLVQAERRRVTTEITPNPPAMTLKDLATFHRGSISVVAGLYHVQPPSPSAR
jgi:hypothetical protein